MEVFERGSRYWDPCNCTPPPPKLSFVSSKCFLHGLDQGDYREGAWARLLLQAPLMDLYICRTAFLPTCTATMCTCTATTPEAGTVASGDMGTETAAKKQYLQELPVEFADVF